MFPLSVGTGAVAFVPGCSVPVVAAVVDALLLPSCQLLYVYDAGHATAADRPEAFAEAVTDFLARHEQYVVSQRSSVLFP